MVSKLKNFSESWYSAGIVRHQWELMWNWKFQFFSQNGFETEKFQWELLLCGNWRASMGTKVTLKISIFQPKFFWNWKISVKVGTLGELTGINGKAPHSELLTEVSCRFSSRNEFSRVEMGQVEHHFFVTFGNFGKRLLPKLAKTKSSEKARKTRPDSKKVRKFRVGTSFWTQFHNFCSQKGPNWAKNGHFLCKISELFSELSWVFRNFREFGRLGHYRNISEIQKKLISETRENENFGKNRLSQGLNQWELKWNWKFQFFSGRIFFNLYLCVRCVSLWLGNSLRK